MPGWCLTSGFWLRRWKCSQGPVRSFCTLPIYCLLHVPPHSSYCLCPGGSTCHLSPRFYYDWSPGFWFHHMATPASGCLLYATCLFPSGPRLKPSSESSLPIGESLASKQSIGLSGPGACSLSHPYLWTLPAPTTHSKKHEPNYWWWFRCQHFAHVGPSAWKTSSLPHFLNSLHMINLYSFSKYLYSLRTHFSERFWWKTYYRLWKVPLLIIAIQCGN